MMTRAWLILADILVMLLLAGSLVLFYLYPLQETKKPIISSLGKSTLTPTLFPHPLSEINETLTVEDLIRMGQEVLQEEYMVKNTFLTQTLEEGLAQNGVRLGDPVLIRIFKQESLLEVWIRSEAAYRHIKDYAICAFSGGLGPKLAEGDGQSPEGFYKVRAEQLHPNSKFHLAFNLGYPNKYDRAHERTGSFLMVHGNCVSMGCYAMTDEKIEEIYALVEGALHQGQPYVWVHIYPFRMTEQNMALHADNQWSDFWANLKEGYDYFETEALPPSIKVENKRYRIQESNDVL